jgi:3-methyl-2-oxobutanoate hydroxymethyltransferase
MPFLSYQVSVEEAVRNAGRFYKEALVDAIKLEGGWRVCAQIRAIVDGGMLVMGHIGLTPQSSGQLGGFKAQGRTAEMAMELIEDAQAIQEAGAFSLLVEAVPPEVCGIMRQDLKIPVYNIGAGIEADGQLMICSDVLGVFQAFTPKFVKKYEDIADRTIKAFSEYAKEVRAGQFPKPEHTYKMVEGELPKLEKMLQQAKKAR